MEMYEVRERGGADTPPPPAPVVRPGPYAPPQLVYPEPSLDRRPAATSVQSKRILVPADPALRPTLPVLAALPLAAGGAGDKRGRATLPTSRRGGGSKPSSPGAGSPEPPPSPVLGDGTDMLPPGGLRYDPESGGVPLPAAAGRVPVLTPPRHETWDDGAAPGAGAGTGAGAGAGTGATGAATARVPLPPSVARLFAEVMAADDARLGRRQLASELGRPGSRLMTAMLPPGQRPGVGGLGDTDGMGPVTVRRAWD